MIEPVPGIPTLIVCVGLPRSGKTTWAKDCISKSPASAIVNPDSIRLALHGQRYAQEAESFVWAIARVMVVSLFKAGHNVVILDGCFQTKMRRDPWFSEDWNTYFAHFNVSYEVCRNRAIAMKDDYILPIIDRMNQAFEPLTADEVGIDGTHLITVG